MYIDIFINIYSKITFFSRVKFISLVSLVKESNIFISLILLNFEAPWAIIFYPGLAGRAVENTVRGQ